MASYSLNTPYITVAGVVVIAIVVVFTILSPLMADIQASRATIASLEVAAKTKEDFVNNIDRKREQLQIQKVHEERLNVMLPTDNAYDDAIRTIHIAATAAGATVQKISDQSASAQSIVNSQRSRGEAVSIPETVLPLAAAVEVVSTYQQLRAFLENIEKAPRLTDVYSISTQRQNNQPDQLSTKIIIQFYRRAEAPAQGL